MTEPNSPSEESFDALKAIDDKNTPIGVTSASQKLELDAADPTSMDPEASTDDTASMPMN